MDEQQNDLALLQQFEPILRFTKGEEFFPSDVDTYVQHCSLWVDRPQKPPRRLVPHGELTLADLGEMPDFGLNAVFYLKFAAPLGVSDMATWFNRQRNRSEEQIFRVGRGRLARVGYFSRLVDALFSLTLLLRGRVPGSAAVAATLTVDRWRTTDERFVYYGRVLRQHQWTILQYWFFYPFNNWRSGFFGVNDHEGDWETISIYLSQKDGQQLTPDWVAYSEHDYAGDDLRRRWDDPEVEIVDGHPVVYAGAGSHAGYYRAGEYLAEVSVPFLAPVARLIRLGRDLWLGLTGNQSNGVAEQHRPTPVITAPFVDYARGDGIAIGPQQERVWQPVLLDPLPPWVGAYRGLWGLFARDPISGENAPGGPMYNRDGSVRQSWYDPLGWAGLNKVPAPSKVADVVQHRQRDVQEEIVALQADIQSAHAQLATLYTDAEAMRAHPHFKAQFAEYQSEIRAVSANLDSMKRQETRLVALAEALTHYGEKIRDGYQGPMREHIHRAAVPTDPNEARFNWLAEAWAAISIALLMLGFVVLVTVSDVFPVNSLLILTALLIVIEAGFRRRLARLMENVAIFLALIATLVLLDLFFWPIIAIIVMGAATYIMWENLQELWR